MDVSDDLPCLAKGLAKFGGAVDLSIDKKNNALGYDKHCVLQ